MFPSLDKLDHDDHPLAELLPRVRRQCLQIFHRFHLAPEDAEDLLQTTLLLLLGRYDTIDNPEAWIVGTLRNRCIMRARARRRPSEPLFVELDTLETLAPPHRSHELPTHARVDLERLLPHLPPSEYRVALLYLLGDHSSAHVARRLGYRRSSVRRMAGRARGTLRTLFGLGRRGPVSTG